MSHIVESEFTYRGLKCVVVMQSMGHRCGYVGIKNGHPLYGKDYNSYLDIKKADLEGREVSGVFQFLLAVLDSDERIKIDAYFQVHGGITYSGGGENSDYPIESDLWWFGFDCGHAGDKNDFEAAKKLFSDDLETVRRLEKSEEFEKKYPTDTEVVRSCEYVKSECKKLADQLVEYKQ